MMGSVRKHLGAIRWGLHGWFFRLSCVRFALELANPLWVARRFLRHEVARQAHLARGWMLDVGCGGQPYRKLFDVERYIATDLPPTRGVDLHSDALRLPFADESFDTVLCNQVLEHVPDPRKLMSEVRRVLMPGGVLLLTTPQVWGLHHEPYDFFRYTPYGLRSLSEQGGLTVVHVGPTCGLWATLAQRMADTVVHLYARRLPRSVIFLLGLALWPILALAYVVDRVVGKRGDTLDNVLVARKPTVDMQELRYARAA